MLPALVVDQHSFNQFIYESLNYVSEEKKWILLLTWRDFQWCTVSRKLKKKKLKSDFFDCFDFLDFSDAFDFFVMCLSYGLWPFLLQCLSGLTFVSICLTRLRILMTLNQGKNSSNQIFLVFFTFFHFLQLKFSDFQLKKKSNKNREKIKNIGKSKKINKMELVLFHWKFMFWATETKNLSLWFFSFLWFSWSF